MITIKESTFGYAKNSAKVTAFSLSNSHGVTVTLLDYGATIQSIIVPDRNGNPLDIVLGYDDIASYEKGSCFYGAVVGRYANRIGYAKFTLDGKEYRLENNTPTEPHHIHGTFAHRMFHSRVENQSIVFSYLSPDGEERFPGNLSLEVKYTLKEDNSLELFYKATTDAPTVVNLTNHCYFNLNGQDGSTILDHKVYLNCSYYTEYDPTFAQTGKIISVSNTPLDFRAEQTIGARFTDDYHQFRICTGYDHNMVIDGPEGSLKPIGTIKNEKTGIMVEAFTTEPAIQFYSGNFIQYDAAEKGKGGVRYPKNGGVCMETQHYPDSVNHPHFPSTVLRPEETYTQQTIFKFGLIENL